MSFSKQRLALLSFFVLRFRLPPLNRRLFPHISTLTHSHHTPLPTHYTHPKLQATMPSHSSIAAIPNVHVNGNEIGGSNHYCIISNEIGGSNHYCTISNEIGGSNHYCTISNEIGGSNHYCTISNEIGGSNHNCIIC
ncbi:hypothetical protein PCANC_05581 [Puccinia coronata f. sp. avenae]|uniref:Uncharacterized protein n=1 Tax=Puccinia coronata f. sp. avenae TaxID=200324 RepID=A0A2N5VPA3_9BASI|nr:hypothetical protein PCANC_05581 [Puccinia coronata f. sp. avenae]